MVDDEEDVPKITTPILNALIALAIGGILLAIAVPNIKAYRTRQAIDRITGTSLGQAWHPHDKVYFRDDTWWLEPGSCQPMNQRCIDLEGIHFFEEGLAP